MTFRILVALLLVALILGGMALANCLHFAHCCDGLMPGQDIQEVSRRFWPRHPYKEYISADGWKVWSFHMCSLRLRPPWQVRLKKITDLKEDYDSFEILFDNNGKVQAYVHCGESSYVTSSLVS